MKYAEYIVSDLWFAKRKEIISQRGSKCEICGSTKKIHVHHKTYARMGNEKPEDLQPFDRDQFVKSILR